MFGFDLQVTGRADERSDVPGTAGAPDASSEDDLIDEEPDAWIEPEGDSITLTHVETGHYEATYTVPGDAQSGGLWFLAEIDDGELYYSGAGYADVAIYGVLMDDSGTGIYDLYVYEKVRQVPAGALATVAGGAVSIIALVCSPDGDRTVRAGGEGPIEHAAVVGEETAERALRDGADRILEEIRDA